MPAVFRRGSFAPAVRGLLSDLPLSTSGALGRSHSAFSFLQAACHAHVRSKDGWITKNGSSDARAWSLFVARLETDRAHGVLRVEELAAISAACRTWLFTQSAGSLLPTIGLEPFVASLGLSSDSESLSTWLTENSSVHDLKSCLPAAAFASLAFYLFRYSAAMRHGCAAALFAPAHSVPIYGFDALSFNPAFTAKGYGAFVRAAISALDDHAWTSRGWGVGRVFELRPLFLLAFKNGWGLPPAPVASLLSRLEIQSGTETLHALSVIPDIVLTPEYLFRLRNALSSEGTFPSSRQGLLRLIAAASNACHFLTPVDVAAVVGDVLDIFESLLKAGQGIPYIRLASVLSSEASRIGPVLPRSFILPLIKSPFGALRTAALKVASQMPVPATVGLPSSLL